MGLDFQQSAGDEEKLLLTALQLNAYIAGLELGDQRGMPGSDTQFAGGSGSKHHGAFSGPDLLFGADDFNLNGGHCIDPLLRS